MFVPSHQLPSLPIPSDILMDFTLQDNMATFFRDKMGTAVEEPLDPDEEKRRTLTRLYEDNEEPNQYENNLEIPETQPNKRRKKKSPVWEHFTIETLSDGSRKASCNNCRKMFSYSTGQKVVGTSHLIRHIAKGSCHRALLHSHRNNPPSPSSKTPSKPRRGPRTPSTRQINFDLDGCRKEIVRMIIMHDYPLHMVEHPEFVTFAQILQPKFDMVSFNILQADCIATYLVEKQSVAKVIDDIPGRVCLTLDTWTSSLGVGYVSITGHFIDADWNLQRRLLNVVMEPYPESDTALNHAVSVCLNDWSLQGKVFSITFNQPEISNGAALENLRPFLSLKSSMILNGQFLLGNCIARTLSSIAKDVLGEGRCIVERIRDSVKYVKTTDAHEEKFLQIKNRLQVPSARSLSLDDQTQWNTTYEMLVAAFELKEVFSCLDTFDPGYNQAPSMEDWKQVEIMCSYLKLAVDAANLLRVTTNYPTAITLFHEVYRIQTDLARSLATSYLSKKMYERFDRYWKNCSLALATVAVMDPRFKMKFAEFSFKNYYGEESPAYIKMVDDGIRELFDEYLALPLPLTPTYAEEGSNLNCKADDCFPQGEISDNGLRDFDMYLIETASQEIMKSELDQYLDESLENRAPDFDLLGWWRVNQMKYPTLSKMARDILTIPVSTVGCECVFDVNVKEMDEHRSCLRPDTVEALICAKDWMLQSEASNAVLV